MTTAYVIWVLVLAGMLFFPASKMIWILSVRRLERRENRQLSDQERDGQKNRARFIAAFVCLVFSALFNLRVLNGA